MAQGVAALSESGRAAFRETRRAGAEGSGLERRTRGPVGVIPEPRGQACAGRQARPATGVVPLVAGGIPRLAVCPAVGHESADLRQTPEQTVESGRTLTFRVCVIPCGSEPARESVMSDTLCVTDTPSSRAGSLPHREWRNVGNGAKSQGLWQTSPP